MISDSKDSEKPIPVKSVSLGRVLDETEEIKEDIEEAASNLSSVNEILEEGKDAALPAQALADVHVQSEAVENQIAKAADDLEQVNADLATEVTERIGLEAEMAEMKIDLVEVQEKLSESRANEEETRQAAFKDPLTALPNRTLFEDRLDHGLIQAKRHGRKLAVMFIDLDQFKSINDSYGHALGDDVLLMVAKRLQDLVRSEDTVSRWGGDEFVCLLLNVQQETDVAHLAEKMVFRIAETCVFGETVLSVRASIGVAIYPGDGEAADALIKNADEAMYKAKKTEKGVVLFRESR
ncbi:MAG: diguanylate cyclase [Deltaproteobacteria bacterium RIFOXYB12_FULL_58_9]|nr:MAG: diguanylate cyclase [Deltaproteobacteria bacterium RIFOXYB12_FULL_58_9]